MTASKLYYAFAPSSATFNNVLANHMANFTAAVKHQAIRGHLSKAVDGGSMIGVPVTLSGSQPGRNTTDEESLFTFADLPASGSYNVMPSLDEYKFTAGTRGFNNLPADLSIRVKERS